MLAYQHNEFVLLAKGEKYEMERERIVYKKLISLRAQERCEPVEVVRRRCPKWSMPVIVARMVLPL